MHEGMLEIDEQYFQILMWGELNHEVPCDFPMLSTCRLVGNKIYPYQCGFDIAKMSNT